MLKRVFQVGIAALLLGVLVFGGSSYVANAQAGQTDLALNASSAEVPGSQVRLQMGPGYGDGESVGFEAAAEALGMTADELSIELWGGGTLAELAEEAGVELADVYTAVQDAQQAERIAAIEELVEAGEMTREEADWRIEGIEQGYLGGHHSRMGGYGFGQHSFGRHDFGGYGFDGSGRGMHGGGPGHMTPGTGRGW